MRIGNIFEGTDTSAKGRTFHAFQLAYAIAELIFEWSPNVTLREGLTAKLLVTGVELWG